MWPALERQRYLVDFTLSSLRRRRGKNLTLLLVYALVVFAAGSVLLFTQALRAQAEVLLRSAPDVVVQRLEAGRHDLVPEAWLETLRGIRGVSAARGRLWGYYYDPATRANYTVMVPEQFWAWDGQVAVGAAVARLRGVAAGQRISLRAYDGTELRVAVREVLREDAELVSGDLLLLSREDFRRLFGGAPGRFTDVSLRVPNPREVATVAAKVTRLLPDARPISHADIARTYRSILDWRSGLVVVVLTGAVLAFAVVAWDKASGLSAEERREIGVLKAVGWETSDVLVMKVWEGAVLSVVAFGIGTIAAYVHVFLTSAALLRPVLEGWSALYPRFTLVPSVSAPTLAVLFVLTVVPYTAATLVPAWRAATIDPDAVMRS